MGTLRGDAYQAMLTAAQSYFERAIPAGEYHGWLATPPDRPREIIAGAGVLLTTLLPTPAGGGTDVSRGPQGLIMNVFTEKGWRRRGLATLLVRHVLGWARERGVARLVLHASDEGRPLYLGLGFVENNEMRYAGDLGTG